MNVARYLSVRSPHARHKAAKALGEWPPAMNPRRNRQISAVSPANPPSITLLRKCESPPATPRNLFAAPPSSACYASAPCSCSPIRCPPTPSPSPTPSASTPSMWKAARPPCWSTRQPAHRCWSTPAGLATRAATLAASKRHARRRHPPPRSRIVMHFHTDHVGGVPELVKRVPIGEFLDHGVNREDPTLRATTSPPTSTPFEGKKRRIIHAGDTIDLPGLRRNRRHRRRRTHRGRPRRRAGAQPLLRHSPEMGPGRHREPPLGRHPRQLRQVPLPRSRRPDRRQRSPLMCPSQPHRHDRPLPCYPPRYVSVQLQRHCQCPPSPRCHHGQRRSQGRQP